MPEPVSGSLAARLLFQLRLFFIALQFFTRLPVPAWVGFESHWLQQASRFFPAVGIVVGAACAAAYLLFAQLLPHSVAVLLSMAFGVYLTGAFHEDGFTDVCDAFGGGMSRERVLTIMTDSRIGAYGAIGVGLLLATKAVALASLSPATVVAALLLAHPLSRLAATALMWRLDYVKETGKARPVARRMRTGEFAFAALTVVPIVLVISATGWLSLPVILAGCGASAVAALWLARIFVRRIGGYTGDCLGAAQQLSEVALYLGVLAALA